MRRRQQPKPTELQVIAEEVRDNPSDGEVRARYAAALIRGGYYAQAQEQLDICLALCPPASRKRLLVAVLRARVKNIVRRGPYADRDTTSLL